MNTKEIAIPDHPEKYMKWSSLEERLLKKMVSETARLRSQLDIAVKALKHSRACLEIANNDGLIFDTLWAGDAETLFDYMDYALAQIRELEK